MQRTVEFSVHFDRLYRGLPAFDQDRVDDFTEHFESYGLTGLPGKIAPSWKVPGEDPQYYEKVAFAQEHNLWHYHIGVPEYQLSVSGKYSTSDWVVHFQRGFGDISIRLVDYDFHSPMTLPAADLLL